MRTLVAPQLPGNAVPGGRGVLALHAVASPPPPEPGGARDGVVLAQLVQTGLAGHVEPHGLLVVDVDALSGGHVSLGEREPSMRRRPSDGSEKCERIQTQTEPP